jgi:hypothetical protein
VRQRREFDRHSERREFSFDEIAPAARALQPFAEPIRKPVLIANSARCRPECLAAYIGRPQCKHARFFRTQIVARATGQRAQGGGQGVAALLDASVALAAPEIRRHIELFVDNRKIPIVVQNPLIRVVAGEYRHPKIDIGL